MWEFSFDYYLIRHEYLLCITCSKFCNSKGEQTLCYGQLRSSEIFTYKCYSGKENSKTLQENTSRRKRKIWIHHTWYVVVLQLQKQILWQQVIFYFLLTITIYQLSVEWSPIIEEKQNANVVSTLIWIRPVIWVLLCAVISKKAASKWPTSQFNWISLKLWKCINYSWTRFSVGDSGHITRFPHRNSL